MKRMKPIIILAACLCLALTALGCASQPVSRSSSSEAPEVNSDAGEEVQDVLTYALIIGNDSRYGTSEDTGVKPDDPSYGDTIMLARIDPTLNSISIVSIPRDTAADLNGAPEKINAVHLAGGPEALANEVASRFGVEVPYYFDMKFVDFAELIDKLGGVELNVPMTVTGGDIISGEDITLNEGENTLDGASALMIARQRKVYAQDGEAIRQMISRQIVANAIQAVANQPEDEASTYAGILESVGTTNMPKETLSAYIADFMAHDDPIAFNLGTMPYEGGIDETGVWRIPNDPDVNSQLVNAMETGTPLSDIVALPVVG